MKKFFNFDLNLISKLGFCKIENIYWDNKLKFKLLYFLEELEGFIEEDIYF